MHELMAACSMLILVTLISLHVSSFDVTDGTSLRHICNMYDRQCISCVKVYLRNCSKFENVLLSETLCYAFYFMPTLKIVYHILMFY